MGSQRYPQHLGVTILLVLQTTVAAVSIFANQSLTNRAELIDEGVWFYHHLTEVAVHSSVAAGHWVVWVLYRPTEAGIIRSRGRNYIAATNLRGGGGGDPHITISQFPREGMKALYCIPPPTPTTTPPPPPEKKKKKPTKHSRFS